MDVWLQEERLRGRGTETEDSLQKRLGRAKAEMEYGKKPITVALPIYINLRKWAALI